MLKFKIIKFKINSVLYNGLIMKFPFPNPTKGCHLCSDEISWRMPVYG